MQSQLDDASRSQPLARPTAPSHLTSCSLVRHLHDSLYLYQLPALPSPSPLERHVHAALTRFHRAGGPSAHVGDLPQTETLTLLGAALKYNGLSCEQGYRSCCAAAWAGASRDPSALFDDAILVEDFISFAIDLLDPYLPAETTIAAVQLVVANCFDPLSTGCITFENWCLALLKFDDAALHLARDFKSRGMFHLQDAPSPTRDGTVRIHLLPLPPLPLRSLSHHPPSPSLPLPKLLTAESEAQLLLELVSGECAAEAFEATTAADHSVRMVADSMPTVGRSGSSAGSPHTAATNHAFRGDYAAHSSFQGSLQPLRAGERSSSPAGCNAHRASQKRDPIFRCPVLTALADSLGSTVSEAGVFTDGWDKAEWKQHRRLNKASPPPPPPPFSNTALPAQHQDRHRQQLERDQEQRMEQEQLPPPPGNLSDHALRRRDKHQRLAQDIAVSLLQQQLAQARRRYQDARVVSLVSLDPLEMSNVFVIARAAAAAAV